MEITIGPWAVEAALYAASLALYLLVGAVVAGLTVRLDRTNATPTDVKVLLAIWPLFLAGFAVAALIYVPLSVFSRVAYFISGKR